MKIIIIGAGISGLSTYIALRKHASTTKGSLTVHIYDAYNVHKLNPDVKPLSEAENDEPVFTPVAIGNAVGVSQNGLNVLRRLDDDGHLLSQVLARGNPVKVWRMSNARGWTLANAPVVQNTNGEKGSSKLSHENVGMVMIARQDLWEVLRDRALEDGDVVSTKRVRDIAIGDGNTKSVVTFEDNSSDEADLIIGADGLRSALRRVMFQQPLKTEAIERPEISNRTWVGSLWTKKNTGYTDYVTPHYEGLGGCGGFIPTTKLTRNNEFKPDIANIVFGANGFFGYICISPPSSSNDTTTKTNTCPPITPGSVTAWWSTFASPQPYPYRQTQSSTKSSSSTSTTTFDSVRALSDLTTRHKTWHNPTIHHILSYVSETGLVASQYYPTWTTPELPTWQKNGTAILIGDAAHTLQPSSGQGVSQALEDAEALALLLGHYLGTADKGQATQYKAVATALEKFEALRKPRVHMVYERSQKMGRVKGDLGFVTEMMVYFFVWLMSLFHDKFNDVLFEYDLPGEVRKIVA